MAILKAYVWSLLLLLNVLKSTVLATPLYTSPFSGTGIGRNIRHLECISRKTGEKGVCMFALNCVKANGTHLGTCLDSFYFGSCCKINDMPAIFPQDNSIDELNGVGSTAASVESNDIPDYQSKLKPVKVPAVVMTEKPIKSTYTTPTTVKMTTITMAPSIALSTFQTIQDNKTPTVTKAPTTVHYSRPSTTDRIVTTQEIMTTQKIMTTESFVKRPTVSSSISTAQQMTTTERAPGTRFPPRNATTTQASTSRRPITTTRRPLTSASTKKPTTITKRPSRPTGSSSTRPSTSSLKPTTFNSSRPLILTSTKPAATTNVPSTLKPVVQETTLPSSTVLVTKSKPNVTTTVLITTEKPSVGTTEKIVRPTSAPSRGTVGTTSRPKPSSKPTKGTVTSVKPTKTSVRPTIGNKVKPRPSSTTAKPSTKPRPPSKPSKPGKPSKPTQGSILGSTIGSTLTIQTTVPSTSTVRTTTSTSTTEKPLSTSTTTIKTTSTTTTTEEPVTLTNEILPPKITSTTENISSPPLTSSTEGFITWSSNSDSHMTSTSVSSTTSTTSIPVFSEVTETQWSPITTPDGWVIIQSPSTKVPEGENVTEGTKVTSTLLPPVSVESTTQETTAEPTTSKSTVPTVTSSPASTVTTGTPETLDSLNMSDYKQVCGRRLFPESRIVGGDRSSFGKWPWQISLRQWRTSAYLHKCGAALLNENWAITAAHCVENVPPSDLLLRIGEHDLANEEEPYGFQERRVQIVASHPNFDPRTFEYDLALLRFYEPLLPFQPNLLPICLPDDDEGYVGHTAYVTGWGRLYEDGPLPSVLQEVSVPVINNTVCETMYKQAGFIEHIPHIFICAGWRKGGFDSCEGDSGGPLVIQRPRDKRWILAGVISWGIGCAEPNQPGVYTRISEFREWINQILQF